MCLDMKISKCLVSNLTNMCNFHPREVVGHGSELEKMYNLSGGGFIGFKN